MKTIGLIGGMSWESSIEYYRMINEMVRKRLGGLHSARNVMVSVDFAEIEVLQAAGRWEEAGQILAECGQALEAAGGECIILCTNTMHRVAAAIEAAATIPLIHIADPTAVAIKQKNLHKVGLLATNYTMTQDFYRGRLVDHHGLDVIVPPEADRKIVHDVIYDELCLGIIAESSKTAYLEIIDRLIARGAEAIILGCTEVGLLVKDGDCDRPLFDTTVLHAAAAVEFALTP